MTDDKVDYGSESSEAAYKRSLREADQDTPPDPGRDMTVEGNDTSAYIGTDPIYQNYSNDTEKPYAPEAGTPDAAIVDEFVAVQQGSATDITTGEEADKDQAQPPTGEATLTAPTRTSPGGSTTGKGGTTGKADTK